MREGRFCGPRAPVVLRGRGGEVLVGRPEREVGIDLLLLGQVPLEVGCSGISAPIGYQGRLAGPHTHSLPRLVGP